MRARSKAPAGERSRRAGLAAILAVGFLAMLLVLERHDALGGWLFFRYLQASLLALVFGTSCLVAGHALLLRSLGQLALAEHVALAVPLGLVAFFLVSFTLGVLGLYGPSFFWLCPALLLAVGARPALRSFEGLRRHLGGRRWRIDAGHAVLLGAGLIGIGLVWFPVLSPNNVSYDARWYHLPIAQHYLAAGRLSAFSEGWVPGALPQLWSVVCVWPLAAPGTHFDRIETAAHMELVLFVATLVGVAALARRAAGERVPGAWVAIFLFPGLFCYDSSLVLGADHVAAVFAPAAALLSYRHLRDPSREQALLLGVIIAGVLLTKYTAAILALLPLGAVTARLVCDVRSGRALAGLRLVGWVALSSILVSAPHWLKNALFYGDPLFPLLRQYLPAQPWSAAAEAPHRTWFALQHPAWGVAGLLETLKTLVTFSFVPHDFPQYHRNLPVFGSLFTLLTPAVLLIRPRRELLWLFSGVYLGIAGWVWLHQLDRYLQVLLPWMAAGTAVVGRRLWREGGGLRAGVGLLFGLQVVWGASVPFIPSHRASGGRAIQHVVVELLSARYRGAQQLETFSEWQRLSEQLPPAAKVLVHEEEIHLGLERQTALDYSGDQGAFYWGEPGAATAADIWKMLRAHGVTHLVWARGMDHGTDTVAAGLAFFDFALHHTRSLGTYGGFQLAALTDASPVAEPIGLVAYYPCEGTRPFATGLYPLTALSRTPNDSRPIARPRDAVLEQALEQATFVVWDASCRGPLPASARSRFELLAARGRAMLMRRKGT